jgi:hypothetical protein
MKKARDEGRGFGVSRIRGAAMLACFSPPPPPYGASGEPIIEGVGA